MRTLLLSALLALAACSPATGPAPAAVVAPPATPAYSYEVVATYPHDPKAFTQ